MYNHSFWVLIILPRSMIGWNNITVLHISKLYDKRITIQCIQLLNISFYPLLCKSCKPYFRCFCSVCTFFSRLQGTVCHPFASFHLEHEFPSFYMPLCTHLYRIRPIQARNLFWVHHSRRISLKMSRGFFTNHTRLNVKIIWRLIYIGILFSFY